MKQWPNNAFLRGYYEPLTAECMAQNLVVEGEIPRELNGTFYRNGPNPQFPPENEYHLFTGDGMIHAFNFEDGRVSYQNRWAQTERFKIERREGMSLFSGINPLETDPRYLDFVLNDKEGVANTSVVFHGDRLLLLEEGHLPFEMDADTLESQGAWRFYGKLNTTMSAHPKIDPVNADMHFHAYMTAGPFTPDMGYYQVNAAGHMQESHHFQAPYSAMVHDMVVTENYVLFPVMPITGDLGRAMEGKPPFAWEPDKPTLVGVMPRSGTPDDIRWIEGDACYVFHFANGSDVEGVITVEACHFDSPPLFPMVDGTPTPANVHPSLARWTIDMNASNPRVKMDYLADHGAEFPVIDPRFAMREYQHTWYTSSDRSIPAQIPDSDVVYNAIVRFDVKSHTADSYAFDAGYVAEPMFVPRSADAPEGVGWVLSTVYDIPTNTSALCIFDSLNISAGPIAKAWVSHRVPVSFHGTWRPA
ncbi:carotenoid oxygenase family protein [Halieaceae bacterium IMCC8485]|jgi:carotenoid cleavage dioxygenase|uniref:Carotenoid oxygenase family protein n=1 Tax=Candidatus Seongchinamella marina TaxID=2518990 RepID=A0ABT3SQW8_9GAMM|nr:carotenoid oxygenase family protein [Candidatus Seongchinamella marina]MCX2972381.1 carotenoid oxygenase family protein [Candidatus Seongchinamella marina]